ncbi:MAG: AMP-binding protein [Burkholderiaceae bacterium]
MNPWHDFPVPPMRHEALHGDRLVRCFADRPASLHAMFTASLARNPDADALVCDGRRWSYAQCDLATRRFAAELARQGVARGDRVVMLIDNRPEFVVTLLALQRLGAIAVPVGVREQGPGLAYIVRQCSAIGIVADAGLADRVPDASQAPTLRLHIGVGNAPGEVSIAALLAAPDAVPLPEPAATAETDVAAILYTSGTTGHPKGAMLTQLNIVHSVLHFQACMRLTAQDRSALAVPASHVTGLIAIVAAMLQVGGAIVIVPAFKAGSFIALLAAERVTHTLMVPAMYNLCLLHPDFAAADLSAWRIGAYGGAPMPVSSIDALADRLPGLTLLNAYGATETTSPATMMPAGHTRAHADSVGVALPAAEIRVMDEAGREVPVGESGELWIAGPMVVPGYWADAAASAASFTAGYWHSGDLGAVDAEGYVRVFDRKKDMLNRGGFKIYSVEVESVLMAWPGMVEAAIVGRPCPVLGERVHAFVHAPGSAPDDAALRAFCAARLADYKVPETLTWCESPLPRNPNGKLMKRLLRERLQASSEAPRST